MSNARAPDLKKYLDKKIQIKLNANRVVSGVLRGYDPFMNLVMDNVVQIFNNGQKQNVGMVVLRGESILTIEALERVDN